MESCLFLDPPIRFQMSLGILSPPFRPLCSTEPLSPFRYSHRRPIGGMVMDRRSACFTLACLALLTFGTAIAAEPLIVVTGSGSAEIQPDRVTIEFSVLDRAKSAADASEASARRTQPILAALRNLGVPDSAVTSSGFAVQPTWDHKRGVRKDESMATHRLRIRVSEIRKAGAIVEAVLDKGADRIETVSFSVSNADSARESALAKAVREARDDAEVMAHAAGGRLGSLIEITTQGTAAPPRAYETRSMSATVSQSVLPSITPGPTIVTVTVLGRWTFSEKK